MAWLKTSLIALMLAGAAGCSSSGGAHADIPAGQVLQSRALAQSQSSIAAASASGIAIDAGGAATGSWVTDTGYSGGWPATASSHAITTSHVVNPAPQTVYQTNRVGNSTYTVGGLTPGAAYMVRLHFSETYWNAAGQRTFNVTINGRAALTNFDIIKDSGGAFVADVQSFSEAADANGRLTIVFTTVVNNALVSGIEIGNAAASATPAPVQAAAGSVPTYDGCNIGTAGDAYNADISQASVDPNSAAIIASQSQVDSSSFTVGTIYNSEKANLDEGDTANKYPVTGNPSWHPDLAGNWPWAGNYFIENGGAGDAHALVLDSVTKPNGCKVYESYATRFTGSAVALEIGVAWDLSKAYATPLQNGYPNGGSAQASGLSLFRGLAMLDSIAAGNLNHAVNAVAKSGSLGDCYVYPGSASGGTGYTGSGQAHEMCFGAHLRLHASFASTACASSTQAARIVYGLAHYGVYESDTGNDGNGLYLGETNTSNTWDAAGIAKCLAGIHMSDFDVLSPPAH